jgi:hypothetical protein
MFVFTRIKHFGRNWNIYKRPYWFKPKQAGTKETKETTFFTTIELVNQYYRNDLQEN